MSSSPLEESSDFVQISASEADSAAGPSLHMSRSESPVAPALNQPSAALEDEEDIPDETLAERITALSEMFPGWLRNGVVSLAVTSVSGVKSAYSYSRSIGWVLCSTAAVALMPVLFEIERSSVEEQQKQQQRQILLGPGALPGPNPLMGPPPPVPAAPPLR